MSLLHAFLPFDGVCHMLKKLSVSLILILAVFGIVLLTACSEVSVESISIDPSSEYKTTYYIGDEIDLSGIKIIIKRTDGVESSVALTDIRQDIVVMNFKSDKPKETLSVVIEYKGKQTMFTVSVSDVISSSVRYTLSFDTGEGNQEVEEQEVPSYGTATLPSDPVRAGYAFDGWYKERTFNNKWNFSVDKVISDTVLYAKWAKLYTVTFYPTEGEDLTPIVRYVKSGETLSSVPSVPEIEGKVGVWDRLVFTNVQSNITTQSVYTIKTFRVVFCYMDTDGITIQTLRSFDNVPYGTDMNTDPAYSGEINSINPPNFINNTRYSGTWNAAFNNIVSNLTVQAVYISKEYDISFNVNYDIPNPLYFSLENVIHGNVIDKPSSDPTREGYSFDGWYKDMGCTVEWNFDLMTVDKDMSLFAKWVREYQVFFLINPDYSSYFPDLSQTKIYNEGGEEVEYKVYSRFPVRENTSITKPESPRITGYSSRWDIDDAAFSPVISDLKVVAIFTIDNYTVEFCAEDGTVLQTQYIDYGDPATDPEINPLKTGYNFTGWREDFSIISGNIKIYPLYEAKAVNIKIYPRGNYVNPDTGLNFYSLVGAYDSLIVLSQPIPSYEGHQFEGWYSDEVLSSKWDLSTTIIKQETEINLYANWLNIWEVRFQDEFGSLVPGGLYSIVDGGKVTAVPAIPEKIGHSAKWFLYEGGGFTDEAGMNFWNNTQIRENLFVRPQYVKLIYKVDYVVDSQYTYSTDIEYNSVRVLPSQEYIENYLDGVGKIFVRWEPEIPIEQPVTSNMTFNAVFVFKTFVVTWRDAFNQVLHEEPSVQYGSNAETIFNGLGISRPEKEGYSFTGWRVVIPVGGSMNPITESITLEPVYSIKSYILTVSNRYDETQKLENFSTTESFNDYYTFGIGGNILDPERTGYTFTGWNTARYSIERKIVSEVPYWVITNNNTAKTGIHYYTGGKLILFKDEIYRENPPVNPGLGTESWKSSCGLMLMDENVGWIDVAANNLPLNVKSVALPGQMVHVFGEDSDFAARYLINQYTVTFDVSTNPENVTGEPTDFVAQYGTVPTIPQSPTWPGFVFLGWYNEPEFETRWDSQGGKAYQPLSSNYTVYARWETATVNPTTGITFTLNDLANGYIVSSMTNVESSLSNVRIPNYYNNLPVVGIGYRAVYSNIALAAGLTSIELPNTLNEIANNAFENCTSLVSIEIPAFVKSITTNAFNGCTSLENVTFKAGTEIESIGDFAFYGNTSLENITIPEGVISIGNNAFFGCISLIYIQIPSSVTFIGDGAFANNTKLAQVYFNTLSPINLGQNVFFRNDSSYSFLKIYVSDVSRYATGSSWANENWHQLYDQGKLIDIENISVDGDWSFVFDGTSIKLVQYLGSNELVTVPSSVLTYFSDDEYSVSKMGDFIFDSRVLQVTFESSVEFERDAFSGAVQLNNIVLRIINNNIPISNFDLTYVYNNGGPNLNKFSVSSSKPLIDIFQGTPPSKIKEIEIIEKDEYIVANMFLDCVSIEIVRMDTSIQDIRENAFSGCTSLREIYFKTNESSPYYTLNSVGNDAFSGCYQLEDFYVSDELDVDVMVEGLPSTISTIGLNAFLGTKWLEDRDYGSVIIGDGILYTFKQHASLSPVVMIPSSVKRILSRAFYANTQITHVIPEDIENSSLRYIGESAFRYCSSLEVVAVPDGFISFGNYAFESASKLGTLAIFGTTEVPLRGADFLTNTLRRVVGGISVPGIEIFVDNGLDGTQKASYNDLGISLGYGINYETGMSISYDLNENRKWIYSNGSVAGIKLIKFFGNLTDCFIPENLEGVVTEISDNALSRATTNLSINISVTVESFAFAGITRLTSLSISAPNYASVKTDDDLLYSLLLANPSMNSISSAAGYSIKEVLGTRILPSHISTVNILVGQEVVESAFLEDCEYVTNINILSVSDDELIVTPLETQLDENMISEKNILLNSIKERAFTGTGWMNSIEQDFIVVLDGILVDYKGVNNVLTIPSSVKTVGYGVFKNNEHIEVVYIPDNVQAIEAYAFADAPWLTKIFMAHSSQIPSVEQSSFTVGAGREIFVKGEKLSDYQADITGWLTFAPKVEPDVPLISEEIQRSFKRGLDANLLLEVRMRSYLLTTLAGDKSQSTLNWLRDSYITYDIPDDTPSYNRDSILLSLYPQVSLRESSEVIIPDTISDGAFDYTILALGNNVFMSGVSSISINLDDSVTPNTFSNLADLQELTINKSENILNREISGKEITSLINESSLYKVNYLGSVTLDNLFEIVLVGEPQDLNLRPESIISIEIIDGALTTIDEMLNGWTNISQVAFPDTIESLGVNSLEDTLWFQNYYIPSYGSDFVVAADKVLYKYKGTSSSINVPANVQIVNTGAFSLASGSPGSWTWSSSLTFTTLRFEQGSKAHTIMDNAFYGCAGFNNFNAPDSLRTVATSAFTGTQFTMNPSGLLILEGTYAQGKTIVKYLGDPNVLTIDLTADVKIIAEGAFKNLENLNTISWGGTSSILQHIGKEAFYGCTNLTSVPLNEYNVYTPNISSIGKDAFTNTLFTLNRALRADGKYVVYKHFGGGAYTIDSTVYSVTLGAVTDPPRIILESGASISSSDMYNLLSMPSVFAFNSDGSIPIKDLIGGNDILPNITTLAFTDGVTDIASEYANGWYSVEEILWPSGLQTVGRDAFTGTKWLDDVQNDYVTPGGANPAGVLIKYKGVSPEVFIDYRITSISADAFRGNEDIVSIEFGPGSTLTQIPPGAFSGCLKLEEISNIPLSVNSIGQDAFKNTLWLENKTGLVIINGLLVAYRGSSEAVYIPKEVEKIYPYVFAGNNVITSLEFDKYSVIDTIEANTFANCTMLASVKLSESINFVDSQAFLNTPWLSLVQTSSNGGFIVYEDSYTKEYKLIRYVGTRTTVTIPSQTTEIGSWTFRNNRAITRVTLDKGLYIPDFTFSGCTALAQVELSVNVSIGEHSFEETPWFTSKTAEFVLAGNGYLIKYNGVGGSVTLPSSVKGLTGDVFRNNTLITSLDFSQTLIQSIPREALSGATSLSSVTFNSLINEIGQDAFLGTPWYNGYNDYPDGYVVVNGILVGYKGASSNVVIPSSVSIVPRYVFEGNTSLESLAFDANPVSLEDYAFYGCTSLSSVINPGLIQSLGSHTFRNTLYYSSLSVSNNGYVVINGILLGYEGVDSDISVPANVSLIADLSFENSNINSLSFESRTSEITIGAKAFQGSLNLSVVNLTDWIREVEYRAFYNTYWIDNLPSLFVSTGNKLLMYIGRSTNIEIASNITSMAYGVFTNNKSISSVRFNTTSQNEFIIPENSFNGCTSLNSVTLPSKSYIGQNAFKDTLWLIGKGEFAHYNNRLFGYNGISTSIVLPSNLVGIYDYVFRGNTLIQSISFSATQTVSIANGEFVGCTSLSSVILNNSLQELSTSAFAGTPWIANYSANNGGTKFIILNNTRLLAYLSSDTEVIIPANINFIGKNVFTGNTAITSVSFSSLTTMLQIPNNAFSGCTSLSTVTLTGYIEETGIDAFKDTPWFTGLPNTAYIVANRLLFYKGTATEYSVPEEVTHIGTNAFYGSGITTLNMLNPSPCSLGRGDVLQGITAIYVPDLNALTLYNNNSAWIPYRSYLNVAP